MTFVATPMEERTGTAIARLFVSGPFICNVAPFKVRTPELAPRPESLVMIKVALSFTVTPPVKLLLVSNDSEPLPDFTSDVTPAMPPVPAIVYGSELFTCTGNAKKVAFSVISWLRIHEVIGQRVVE